MAEKRNALPVINRSGDRCLTGDAVITSVTTKKFYKLQCDHVIHAVGPNYVKGESRGNDALLSNAYAKSMRLAATHSLKTVAFSLLSAGIFRGSQSLNHVLRIGLLSIRDNVYPGLEEVHLVGYTPKEISTLTEEADKIFVATTPSVGGK